MHKFSDFPQYTGHVQPVDVALVISDVFHQICYYTQENKTGRENVTENKWRLSNYQTEWITEQTEA